MLPPIDQLWDYRDPAASERRFSSLLVRPEVANAPDYHAELLTQLARALTLQRRYDEASRRLDQVEAFGDRVGGRARLRMLLERGRLLNDLGQTPRALQLFEQAWELGLEIGEEALAVDAGHMLGYCSEPADAVAWLERALEIVERSSDARVRRWRANLLWHTARQYERSGHYHHAESYYRRCRELHQQRGAHGEALSHCASLARVLRLRGKAAEALDLLEQSIAEASAHCGPDGYVYEELGECLLALGDEARARQQFGLAYEQLRADPWFPPGERERLERLRRLSATAGA